HLLDPLKDNTDDTQTITEIVTEIAKGSADSPDSPSDPSARDLFRAGLSAEQRAAFDALPSDIQDQLVSLNDPVITTVALAPDAPHPHQDLRTHLTAFEHLSPEALAFVKTLAGSDASGFDQAPDPAAWSPAAFERTLASWNALSPDEQNLLTSLGAGDAIMDK